MNNAVYLWEERERERVTVVKSSGEGLGFFFIFVVVIVAPRGFERNTKTRERTSELRDEQVKLTTPNQKLPPFSL